MKTQKGITLIALIITIIVMLILVGASVSVALNGGLFSTAQDAAEGIKVEGEKERLLSIVLGALNNKGIVNSDKLEEALEETEFTLNPDGTITSKKTGKTYIVSERGSVTLPSEGGSGTGVTLTWTHADANSNETFDVGEVVTASNGESFYVIAAPGANDETVKLLAAKCVDTRAQINGETNTNYNKQSDTYNTVAFDVGEYDETSGSYYKPDTTTPVTNVYANASIKELVETYVTETLGLNANQGMLMSSDEATALQSKHIDMLYGTTTKLNYWLGSSHENYAGDVWIVIGGADSVSYHSVYSNSYGGLRPVIEISLSDIG